MFSEYGARIYLRNGGSAHDLPRGSASTGRFSTIFLIGLVPSHFALRWLWCILGTSDFAEFSWCNSGHLERIRKYAGPQFNGVKGAVDRWDYPLSGFEERFPNPHEWTEQPTGSVPWVVGASSGVPPDQPMTEQNTRELSQKANLASNSRQRGYSEHTHGRTCSSCILEERSCSQRIESLLVT